MNSLTSAGERSSAAQADRDRSPSRSDREGRRQIMPRSARQLQIVNRGRSLPSAHTIFAGEDRPASCGIVPNDEYSVVRGIGVWASLCRQHSTLHETLLVWMSGPLGVQYHEILCTALITTSFALPREHSECKQGRISCAKPVRVIRGSQFLSSGLTDSIHLSTLAVRCRFTASGRHRTTPQPKSGAVYFGTDD
jgi:hypothetical protein